MCPLCSSPDLDPLLGSNSPSKFFDCRKCGLVFRDPAERLSRSAEKSRYSTHQNSPDNQGYCDFLNQLVEPLCRQLSEGARGIDFGCGPGPTLSHLMRAKGYEVRDYDPFFANDGDLLKSSYDFVTATEVVEHFNFPRESWSTLRSLLRGPGSFLGIMTSCFDEKRISFDEWHYKNDPTHVSFYRKASFDFICEEFELDLVFQKDPVWIFKAKN